MTRIRLLQPAVVVAFAIIVAACDSTEPTEPNPPSPFEQAAVAGAASLGQAGQRAKSTDELFISLHQEVPEFGGMFIGDGGEYLYIHTKDLARGPQVTRALERRFGNAFLQRRGPEGVSKELKVRFLRADFDIQELSGFRASIKALWQDYGMTYLDLDERNNRVHVGVDSRANATALSEHILALGVPGAAVAVEVIAPANPLSGPLSTNSPATFSSHVRAGILAQNPNSGGGACTLGFSAIAGSKKSFVIASHCTETLFGTDTPGDDRFFNSAGVHIGTERTDPPTNNPIFQMRGSDAALITVLSSVAWELGDLYLGPALEQENHRIMARSDFVIGNFDSFFDFFILPGSVVYKYGISTGLTQGQVAATCVEKTSFAPQFTIECVNEVNGPIASGDSGGPVLQHFKDNIVIEYVDPNDPDNIIPWKILGVTSIGLLNSGVYWYSPMSNVVAELGPMKVTCQFTDPGFPAACAP